MSDNDALLGQFVGVTGVDAERAKFYMEAANWDIQVALASFYENDGEPEPAAPIEVVQSDSDEPEAPPVPKQKPRPRQPASNIRTVHTVRDSSSDEEPEEQGQAFYAGGSEHSGQQVLGPPRKRESIPDMFKAVKEHGVEIVDPGSTSSRRGAFRGTGYKLGQGSNDSEVLPGAPEPSPPRNVTLRLWRDGFNVDDGELRSYSDPNSRDFLESIRQGNIPAELRGKGSEVHLAMEDHRMEGYKPGGGPGKKMSLKAFTGQGYTLGSPTPVTVGAPAVQEKDCVANEQSAKDKLKVNPEQPSTNVQIRLADGTRLVGRFNHGHTVAEVRAYIVNARPQFETRPFHLLSSYPSRELSDSETLAEAGLLNSAIMQKLV